MPTRKIRDIDPCDKRFNPCRDPSHLPPNMMVFQPGEYEHECLSCGNVIHFTVYPHHMSAEKPMMNVECRRVHYVDVGHIRSPEEMADFIDDVRQQYETIKNDPDYFNAWR